MSYRREFKEALSLLAQAIAAASTKGASTPILVGGGAAELYTGSEILSGDLDLIAANHEPLVTALTTVGFVPVKGAPNQLTHPRLNMAVEFVSGPLMDGRTDDRRIRSIDVDGSGTIRVIPIEDLIADRVSQALAGSTLREDMLRQALTLLKLAEGVDRTYLDKRIKEETGGGADLGFLQAKLDARNQTQ